MARKRKQPEKPTWAERLRHVRTKILRLTSQAAAAKRFHVALRTYAAWENGEYAIPGPVQYIIEQAENQSEEKI